MNQAEKKEVVGGLKERLAASPNIYFADFTGLTVKQVTTLRRRFRAEGVEFMVAKNTLALRALHEASIDTVDDVLVGPTGLVFAGAEPVGAAKVLADFQKEAEDKPAIKAGLVDGKRVTPDEVRRLASLPSRDELLGQFAGTVQGPLQGFVGSLSGLLNQFVGALEALRAERADAS
ncbi:MAG: 50S ribosomal protein L10 [Gemmatimonadota bacterium]|nr:50S ribosomal protein L10 [Gemmatimonadota bacterium]MDH5803585.1 50S ribosomal protein L10 [Gemmatimonadota bacterium]